VDSVDRDSFVHGIFWLVLITIALVVGLALDAPVIGAVSGLLVAVAAAAWLDGRGRAEQA
jgi:hypothetical protein